LTIHRGAILVTYKNVNILSKCTSKMVSLAIFLIDLSKICQPYQLVNILLFS
jgi:hypothetical protein